MVEWRTGIVSGYLSKILSLSAWFLNSTQCVAFPDGWSFKRAGNRLDYSKSNGESW